MWIKGKGQPSHSSHSVVVTKLSWRDGLRYRLSGSTTGTPVGGIERGVSVPTQVLTPIWFAKVKESLNSAPAALKTALLDAMVVGKGQAPSCTGLP